jgi:hypothetical protein
MFMSDHDTVTTERKPDFSLVARATKKIHKLLFSTWGQLFKSRLISLTLDLREIHSILPSSLFMNLEIFFQQS